MYTIGDRLRILREEKDLSQGEVAKLLGISRPAYVQYETGKTKPSKRINELCALFNVTADFLLGNNIKNNTVENGDNPADLEKFLNKTEIMFDGEVMKLNEENRNKLRDALKFVFFEDKQKKEREKARKRDKLQSKSKKSD